MMKRSEGDDVAVRRHGMKTQSIAFTEDPHGSLTSEKHSTFSTHVIKADESGINRTLKFSGEDGVLVVFVLAMSWFRTT
jgi:hypothetical protein